MKAPPMPHRLGGHAWAGRSVGLLGGSFNPAHDGHLHDSILALRTLKLDQVWWLVTPQNPLKSTRGMAPFAQRLTRARALVRHPRILVTDIETQFGTRYTVDILRTLKERYPHTRFIWIMGADNLVDIRRWKNWDRIFATVPVAVYDRPPYSLKAKTSFAARRYARWRKQGAEAGCLAGEHPPAWAFFHTKLKAISSTAIRKTELEGFPHTDHR